MKAVLLIAARRVWSWFRWIEWLFANHDYPEPSR